MSRYGRLIMALAIGVGVITGSAAAGVAQEATPPDEPGVLPAGCTVVADGLVNPRFIALAADGTLFVTEAGVGGAETIDVPEMEGEEAGPPMTRGDTGQVSAISPTGEQSVIASGLPSYGEGIGPAGIVVGDGLLWIATGGVAVFAGIEPLENENSILQIDLATGEVTQIVELGSYEEVNNPDGTDINPNLYGMDLGAEGWLYVADAGGNTMYRVNPLTGEFALLGVVPAPALPDAELPPDDATPIADEVPGEEPQSVPTGVHVGADGNVYVVTLGAFIPGAAEALIAQADGSFVEAGSGLTAAIGVALGPDGALYVSQLATLVGEAPGPGNVVRIGADGTIETVVEGVPFAHDIAFDDAGNLYVIANATVFGPPPAEPIGQVWRCDGIAA